MITHTDDNGIEVAYSMRPGVNLYAQLGYLSENDPKGKSIYYKNIMVSELSLNQS